MIRGHSVGNNQLNREAFTDYQMTNSGDVQAVSRESTGDGKPTPRKRMAVEIGRVAVS